MKKIEISVYTINELSENAQQTAYNNWLQNFDFFEGDEFVASLNEFAKVFPIKVRNYSLGEYNSNVDYSLTIDSEISELKGIRLLKYIQNNYYSSLFTRKYLGHFKEKKTFWHPCIKNTNKFSVYISNVQFSSDCTLTGVFTDFAILHPIYDFLLQPDKNTTFEMLLNDCIENFCSEYQKQLEFAQSFKSFIEDCEMNEIEFYENGKMF